MDSADIQRSSLADPKRPMNASNFSGRCQVEDDVEPRNCLQYALADWLLACGGDTVPPESIWVYIYDMLEQPGLKV
ncbi:hypothetical protein DN412_29020 [Cupriavidus lacunae]|uniref:Uncharacterized protein n=1 Tax=Cupriavidus lacunae TaxID=2666307 RepID=A0A370NMY7_9BURK|nr:hypothetical protein DN412_29020 [Cupriavidus lacunae]